MNQQVDFNQFSCQIPNEPGERILLSHGSGGTQTDALIRNVFHRYLKSDGLSQGNDAAALNCPSETSRLIVTTDSHVVSPLFYPGGDIGRLAISGTVNDLLTAGVRIDHDFPAFITAGFILEEGLIISDLERILVSMQRCAEEAGVSVVAGDTKVVERGKGDGLYVTTTGIGWLPPGPFQPDGRRAQVGDAVLLTGELASHGMAVFCARGNLGFTGKIVSDNAPLTEIVAALRDAAPNTHVLRDPTRGGLATTLNEIALQSQVTIEIDEAAIPVDPTAHQLCEMLGFDPLQIANEGKMIVIVPPEESDAALDAIRASRYGEKAIRIGKIIAKKSVPVLLRTAYGTSRSLEPLSGELLPRIC